jgi:hypothetical protein
MSTDVDAVFMDDSPVRLTDREARKIVERISGAASVAQFQGLACEERDDALR